jgi:hypothetical protein
MKTWWLARVSKLLGILALSSIVLGLIVMMLWNAIVPDLFQGSTLSFPQAIGLLLLSHILLRGWGPWRYANGWKHDRWKHRFEEKLASLSPEDQEQFKEEWRRRCGWSPDPGHPQEKAK